MLYSFLSDRPFREMQSGGATRNSIAFKENLSRLYQTRGMIKGTERRLTRELEPLDASGFELSDSWIPRILPAERRFQAICMCSPVEERIQRPPPSVRDCENLKWLFLWGRNRGRSGRLYCRDDIGLCITQYWYRIGCAHFEIQYARQPPAEPGRGIKPDHRVLVRPEDLKSGEDSSVEVY